MTTLPGGIRVVLAFVLAPATIPLGFGLFEILVGSPLASAFSMFMLVSSVTYGHAIALGIPTAIFLQRMKRLTLPHVLGAAFLIGAIPLAVLYTFIELTMPFGGSSSFNSIPHRIDGQLTRAGWVSMIDGIAMCGVFGLLTGLVWSWMSGASTNKVTTPTPHT